MQNLHPFDVWNGNPQRYVALVQLGSRKGPHFSPDLSRIGTRIRGIFCPNGGGCSTHYGCCSCHLVTGPLFAHHTLSLYEDLRFPMNVLLIDDETEICFLLKNMLRRVGIECDIAHSMAEGRAQLDVGVYQAVFLDIHLPDGLGYQLIPEIREAQPEVQVIAISAVDNEQKNAKDRGADLFIAKPFDRGSILGGLRSLGLTA